MSSWKSKQLPPGFAKFNFIISKFSSTLTWKIWYQQRLSGLRNVFWQGEIFESHYRRNRKILKKTSAALQKSKTTEKNGYFGKIVLYNISSFSNLGDLNLLYQNYITNGPDWFWEVSLSFSLSIFKYKKSVTPWTKHAFSMEKRYKHFT